MNNMVAWMAKNPVAANLLMLLILIAGALNFPDIRKETFPEISLDMVVTSVAYPGASSEEVEQSVCVRIEEKIHDLEGIKQLSSTANEGLCAVSVEVELNYDTAKMLDDIKARVDSITSFPDGVERPSFREVEFRRSAIGIAISGQTDDLTLKKVAEKIRDDLTSLDSISQVDLLSAPTPEIRIEVSETDLQHYGLTLSEVAQAVKRSSLDLPGGSLKTTAGDVWIRTLGQASVGEQFEQINVRTQPDGSVLKLVDIATVIDGLEETTKITRFNGQTSLYLSVKRVGEESILQVTDAVKDYIAHIQLPEGIEVATWRDNSTFYRSRADLLIKNGLLGFALVFIVLVLFLRFRLAFWVSLGIPISFMGALMVLPSLDGSINMVSMFAFILVLGIVVDDAIVVGENIHTHQERTGNHLLGAILGTQEVAKPVIFAVLTTIVAFMPILYLPGVNGQVWKIIPVIVITTLVFSLIECLFILPAHLGAMRQRSASDKQTHPLSKVLGAFSNGLEFVIHKIYEPALAVCIRWRYTTIALFLVALMLAWGLIQGGFLKIVFFPQVQRDFIVASLAFPQGTALTKTQAAIGHMEEAALKLRKELADENGENSPIAYTAITVGQMQFSSRTDFTDREGNHVGEVALELTPSETRAITTQEIEDRWRASVGDIPGALQLKYNSSIFSGGAGMEIQLAGANVDVLRQASEELKQHLREYDGTYQVSDSNRGGKPEIHLNLRPGVEHLGLKLDDLAQQVRSGFYGNEVQRIQRGRDEVKVWVRYPLSERQTLQDLENMQIRLPDGTEIPFNVVAHAEYTLGDATIERRDRKRIINISAEVDHNRAEAGKILTDLRQQYLPQLVAKYPDISWSTEGRSKDREDIVDAIYKYGLLALIAIYALMAIPFGSYVQPLIIMSAIPFGLVGAVVGHFILGINMSLLSLSGMVAVAGVVVNDNLVLVDYINRARERGEDLFHAIKNSGVARFRAVILTSLTTFVGLAPLMVERSVQAQFLIPMAASLAFGVAFATFVSLLFVPTSYHVIEDIRQIFVRKRPIPAKS